MIPPSSSGAVVVDANVLISLCAKEPTFSTAENALAEGPLRTAVRMAYFLGMANASVIDPFVSDEAEVDVDDETSAAIELGIRAADEGRVLSGEKVQQLIPLWISKFSEPARIQLS